MEGQLVTGSGGARLPLRQDERLEVVWRGDSWRAFAVAPAPEPEPLPEPVRAVDVPRKRRVVYRSVIAAAIEQDWLTVEAIARRARLSETCVRRWLPTLLHTQRFEMRKVPSPQGGPHLAEYRRK